jgi:hypothetical protein
MATETAIRKRVRSHALDKRDQVSEARGGGPPKEPPRETRFSRLLWKLYERWEREHVCEISKDSE